MRVSTEYDKTTGGIEILQERGFTEKDWKLFRNTLNY